MNRSLYLHLLYFYRFFIKNIFFNKNIFNSCFIYLFFLQFIILKLWTFLLIKKDKNLCKIKKSKKIILLHKLKQLKLKKIKKTEQLYFYWLRNAKFKKKKLTKFKKKMICPKKLIWWARNLLINDRVFFIKILLKKRNLFLTLVNNKGKTLLKQNIGSCGFKKRKKFTGFAIEQTTLTFFFKAKKILKSIGKSFRFGKVYINIYIKNSFKYWPYRFIKKGMRKSYFICKEIQLNKLKNFIHSYHSKGLRLPKKRRL